MLSYLLILLGHFNTTLEDYQAIYPDGTFDDITKDDLDDLPVILL